ncbi:Aldehyde dehydrogenase [Mycena indigotica]|uniref:Aldehyde dehydrogenase n=1 Tax=Mycena indigotica TaxID=2126181 RepID=A0A8H6RXR7_9AGAR|nr:Aldehyde dehydrogenase [Mycena indigotica]KAF7289264.1 Aldehyde dehydrogenase [Mycena indigotica]
MKRGFLNAKTTKERLASKNDLGTHPSQLPYAMLNEPVTVPQGYETKPSFVEYAYTALPQVDDEPHTECLFLLESQEILLKTPGFPKPLPPAPARPSFRVAPSPGKGLGLFSTCDIKQGEVILYERPLLIVPMAIPSSAPKHFSQTQLIQHSLNELERYYKVAVDRMTEQRRAAFMSLHDCHTKDGSGPIVGRIRTNGICLSGLQPAGLKANTDDAARMGRYTVISEYISRLNHSCSSNTAPLFDKAMLAYRLYAVRDIAKGEELTFQYVDVLSSKSERNKALKPYDVVCTCPSCTEPTARSDKRRSAIGGFMPTIPAWAANRQLSDDWLIKRSTALLSLIEEERLEHLELNCIATHAIMECYICLGDSENASKWAARVIRQPWSGVYKDHPEVHELLDPKSPAYAKHGLWRMRVDENPTGDMGAIFKMMGDVCGPDGMKTLSGGQGLFMFQPGQNTSPEGLRKIAEILQRSSNLKG